MYISKYTLFNILKSNFWNKSIFDQISHFIKILEDELNVSFNANTAQIHNLKTALHKLKQKGLQTCKKGGRQYKEFVENLKKSSYNWNVGIDCHRMEKKVQEMEAKNEKLEKANKTLAENIAFLQKENQELNSKEEKRKLHDKTKQINNITNICSSRGKRKSFEDCSKSHQSKLRKIEIENCKSALSFLEESGCKVVSVNIQRNGKSESLKIFEKTEKDNIELSMVQGEIEELNILLYILDSFNISQKAYHEISMIYKSLPRSYKLSQYVTALNNEFKITDTPDGLGVQQSLRERLTVVVDKLLKDDIDFSQNDNVLHVKVSGDGTRVGKHLHFVNVTFTVVNESRCGSAQGNYPLAIIKTAEKYEEMLLGLSDIRSDVKDLQGTVLQIGNRTFSVRIYLGGDYKFLLTCVGIPSIQSEFTCIYCKCGRKDRGNISKTWSLSNVDQGARLHYCTHESQGNRKKTNKNSSFSMIRKPLFEEIPLGDVVVDNLHMFLRITDKLFSLLVAEIRMLDNISSTSTFRSGLDIEKFQHMKCFEHILQQLGIKFSFHVNRETSKLEYTDLQGPEKHLLLDKRQISDLHLEDERAKQIQDIWDRFNVITALLSTKDPNPDILQKHVNEWSNLYVSVYQCRDFTPYMHLMRCHVCELVKRHKNIVKFTQQGLEKANDNITKQFYRATNHKGNCALKQILEKQNRMFALEKCQRQKEKQISCAKCHMEGHRQNKCLQNTCEI